MAPLEEYDLPLHIGAVFILLASAIAGVAAPLIAQRMRPSTGTSVSRAATSVFFALRYFGGGIIISTAFIHLLFHAFVAFSNECVGTLVYEAVSPAIAMAALYVTFLADFFMARPLRRRAQQALRVTSDSSLQSSEDKIESTQSLQPSDAWQADSSQCQAQLQKWNVMFLEAGVIFHSVIIGVTIGTAAGTGWVALLIAITFHQFCEGLGLSSRIAMLHSSQVTRLLKVGLHSAFIASTPLGIAIGIGARNSYNSNNRQTLLATGILDSISAGLLLYSGLVQILVNDFLQNKQMLEGSSGRCLMAVFWLTAGLFVMVSRRSRQSLCRAFIDSSRTSFTVRFGLLGVRRATAATAPALLPGRD